MTVELAESLGVLEVVPRIGSDEEKHIEGVSATRGHGDIEGRITGLDFEVRGLGGVGRRAIDGNPIHVSPCGRGEKGSGGEEYDDDQRASYQQSLLQEVHPWSAPVGDHILCHRRQSGSGPRSNSEGRVHARGDRIGRHRR